MSVFAAIINEAFEKKVSDVHFREEHSVYLRQGARMSKNLDYPVDLTQIRPMLLETLNDEQRASLKKDLSVDYSYEVKGVCRVRGNLFYQRRKLSAVYRLIPLEPPTPEELHLPPAALDFAMRPRGLVVVSGPSGAGKSTTMSALVNAINHKKHDHILTIEDPIEFIYKERNCCITQREVGKHTGSFAAGLKFALRQDPDVVVVGDMRDLETVSTAITMAETGHLVITSVHTTGAAETLDRIINIFPPSLQEQIRTQLSLNIQGILSQVLVPRKDGAGRHAIFEVMYPNFAMRNIIRKGDVAKLRAAIETSSREGSINLERALNEAAKAGHIAPETVKETITYLKG
ncbi:MAG: PilT/PilU family type 4a pilus ATPase [Candidatus Wallbacteria bacterium]|nr:PilT/PilU family type 4a pilus ATPase [Candidatus Wallbacteria bacterium]